MLMQERQATTRQPARDPDSVVVVALLSDLSVLCKVSEHTAVTCVCLDLRVDCLFMEGLARRLF